LLIINRFRVPVGNSALLSRCEQVPLGALEKGT